MATVEFDEDEWEPFNDDGFICKRKKRPRLDPTTTTTSAAPPPPDPAAERRNRRERKKRALIKLREKYQKEIDQWVHLSNALKALQEKALTTQQREEWNEEETTSPCDLGVDVPQPSGRQLDELIVRVEAEEEIIQDVSNLCDMAEAICNMQEEFMKQSLVDLPVWGSPRELMASLCDE
ncbi:uncharacterized protein LOC131303991 [Rhododendron vialii]|uniref:uncharacterized protein LOC131303991 n=1 Tax=Rhododendron vialii TaxID=182163 RepID=UPI00265FD2FA|nr:uncharacterized protein LOC131303991 [Rhododendron vialii]